ncbi:HNH endonuclease [Halobacterium rubrum]|uniref:HNH endonuclease n=1 Tax=Halobacterium TaxID=2239 RepID=UPI001F4443FF|nr:MULTISPECIES: HNH endonuclease [Halobacterium]MDH5019019.1 HNH endonuclease [Halobacterium rubrum]
MLLENVELARGQSLSLSEFDDLFGQGTTGKGIEIRYDEKGQKYLWLFAGEGDRYEDSADGETFTFVGENPQGPDVDRPGEENQRMQRGNKELRDAINTPLPIFLFHENSEQGNWTFEGQVEVISYSYTPSEGRYVYEFELEFAEANNEGKTGTELNHSNSEVETTPDINQPKRAETSVSRIIRNTELARRLKEKYDHRCQVCGDQRRGTLDGLYSECHHIRPLGRPHNGPDEASNLLVLCPNHHADFDYGNISVDPDSLEIEHDYEDETDGGELTLRDDHELSKAALRYHNQLIQ